jgi:hypothetical protein
MAETAAPKGHTGPAGRLATYAEFWPYYLGEHRQKRTRALHFFGTGLAIAVLIGAIIAQAWWFLLAAVVCGYLFAWIAHFFVERNRPATFTYPLWSLYSDFRMLGFWLMGKLDDELKRYKIA